MRSWSFWLPLMMLSLIAVTGCSPGASGSRTAYIAVDWRVSSQSTAPLSLSDEKDGRGDVRVEPKKNIAWAGTPLSQPVITVRARLVGMDDPSPSFNFDIGSTEALHYEQTSGDEITLEPRKAMNGSINVSYGGLRTTVPFIVFPTVFLTDNPEQFTWVQAPLAPGIVFRDGSLVGKSEADLYVEKKGELVAPYGFARLETSGFDASFTTELDATALKYQKGPFGIQGPQEAIPSYVFPYLWVVRTGDGGYARFEVIGSRRNQNWELVYEYSPTGYFPAH